MGENSPAATADRLYDVSDFFGPARRDPSTSEIDRLLHEAARLHLARFGAPPSQATSDNVFLWAAERAFGLVCPKAVRGSYESPTVRQEPSVRRAPARQVFVLYRLLDITGRTLYIGITRNFEARLRAHRRRWGEVIADTRREEYDDVEALMEAEAAAIRDERPAFNIRGVDEP